MIEWTFFEGPCAN
jgi:hypothetical protein